MASNITQITDALTNLNTTFSDINVTEIIPTAINQTNESSGGWVGIVGYTTALISPKKPTEP